jgi:hypothetical protein
LAADPEMRWINSRNGYPLSEAELDQTMVVREGEKVKAKLIAQCQKVSLARFERCNNSIRINSSRIRGLLEQKLGSEVQHCKNTSTIANQTMIQYTPRYLVKHRLLDRVNSVYDFCYSHNDSVDAYIP